MTGKIEKWVLENQIIDAEPCTYNAAEILPWARERDAKIEALERRNAELTALLQEYIYHACSSCGRTGLRDDIADRARRALTPTESEAK